MLPETDTLENGKDLKDTELQPMNTSMVASLSETLSMTRETDTELSTGPTELLTKDAGKMEEELDPENTLLKPETFSSKNGTKDLTETMQREFLSNSLLKMMECKLGFQSNLKSLHLREWPELSIIYATQYLAVNLPHKLYTNNPSIQFLPSLTTYQC